MNTDPLAHDTLTRKQAAAERLLPLARRAHELDSRSARWSGFGPEPTSPDAAIDAVREAAEREVSADPSIGDAESLGYLAYGLVRDRIRAEQAAAKARARKGSRRRR
jgi:hypothetical protein